MWIWQQGEWPAFQVDGMQLEGLVTEVAELADQFQVQVSRGSEDAQSAHAIDQVIDSVVDSYQIEREYLQRESVRSSFVRAFHPEQFVLALGDQRADAVARLYRDLLSNPLRELTEQQLYVWHSAVLDHDDALFRGHRVGAYRSSVQSMQVVSDGGATIHFEAPPARVVPKEMRELLDWLNQDSSELGLNHWMTIAFAHLWFLTIHPFDDGNGRIARVLSDWLMMRHHPGSYALVPLTSAILKNKESYYDVLEATQRGSLLVTDWCAWFLERVKESLVAATLQWEDTVLRTQRYAAFWERFKPEGFLPEQKKLIERLLQGGEGNFPDGITRKQYQSLAKVSDSTATRHLQDLVQQGALVVRGQGKSTRYLLFDVVTT